MDIDNFASNEDLESSYWYRTRNAGNTAWTFDTYNIPSALSTGNSGLSVSKHIPPMQAFWVRVKSGKSSATLQFTNAMRGHQDVATNKFRAPAAVNTENKVLRLQVSNGTNSDETILYFHPMLQTITTDTILRKCGTKVRQFLKFIRKLTPIMWQ